ncbi:MAG: MarR family transcriptional regulator [Lachnospiraceae bacterium]
MLFKEDVSAAMLLEQVSHLSRYHAMKKMEAMGIKPGQAGILFILNSEESMSQKELAKKMGITPPSMTAAVKKLETRGYIVKEPDTSDQRAFKIGLSDKGRECVENLKDIMEEIEETVFKGITHDEKLFFKRLLFEMRKNLTDNKELRGLDICSIMEKTRPPMAPEMK